MSPSPKPTRAERLLEREKEQEVFWREQQKEETARHANTARLRALRLAKEAADKAAAEVPTEKPRRASRKRKAKEPVQLASASSESCRDTGKPSRSTSRVG